MKHADSIAIHLGGAHSRFRWVAAGVITLLFGVVAAFGTVQDTPEPVFARTGSLSQDKYSLGLSCRRIEERAGDGRGKEAEVASAGV